MRKTIIILALLVLCIAVFGCAYRHYIGLHGPSIKAFPGVHQAVTEDNECLKCHEPDGNPEGPPTNHPHFTG